MLAFVFVVIYKRKFFAEQEMAETTGRRKRSTTITSIQRTIIFPEPDFNESGISSNCELLDSRCRNNEYEPAARHGAFLIVVIFKYHVLRGGGGGGERDGDEERGGQGGGRQRFRVTIYKVDKSQKRASRTSVARMLASSVWRTTSSVY